MIISAKVVNAFIRLLAGIDDEGSEKKNARYD